VQELTRRVTVYTTHIHSSLICSFNGQVLVSVGMYKAFFTSWGG
jgi:hypothetical protein